MKNNLLTTVIIVLVAAGAAFFGGMKYQQAQATNKNVQFFQNGTGGQGRQFQGRFNNGTGRQTMGEILSVDNSSITVKLQDGSSKIVNITDSTTISKTDTGSKSDLKVGERIAAFGTNNSDGSINADNIQLNPTFFRVGTPNAKPTTTQ